MAKKTLSSQKKKLDRIFSKYIRLRDALITTGTKEYLLCITCKKQGHVKKMHAGHWMSRSRLSTRYDESNVHGQCPGCNTFRGGMPEEHRRAIVGKYSEKEMERIFVDSNKVKKFTISELEDMIKYYQEEYKLVDEQN